MKRLFTPACRHTVVRRTHAELSEPDRHLYLYHVIPSEKGFHCSVGMYKRYTVNPSPGRLFAERGELFYHDKANSCLRVLTREGPVYQNIRDPAQLFRISTPGSGEEFHWCITPNAIMGCTNTAASMYASPGATAAVWHKERLCYVTGQRMYYSRAYDTAEFGNLWMDPNGFGYVDLPSHERGDFVGMAVLNDKLFLFRKFGIDEFIMNYDVSNHRTVPVNYGGGEIVPLSAHNCGDAIRFLAHDGLYEFDGTNVKRVESSNIQEADFTAAVETAVWNNDTYCAHVKRGSARAIYAYNFREGYAYWIGFGGDSMAAAESLYLRVSQNVYVLESASVPAGGSYFECEFELAADGRQAVEWFRVDGSSTVRIRFTTDKGSYTWSGYTGTLRRLNRPLFGATRVVVRCEMLGSASYVRGLQLGLVEVTG